MLLQAGKLVRVMSSFKRYSPPSCPLQITISNHLFHHPFHHLPKSLPLHPSTFRLRNLLHQLCRTVPVETTPPRDPTPSAQPVASSSTTPAPSAQSSAPQVQPAMGPAMQAAMTAFFNTMMPQFQAQAVIGQPSNPLAPPAPAHRSRVKTRDPDPYDGSDPSKLRSFLSQCKLVFRSRPDDYRSDHLKIMYAVSWLKDTAQRWFEPNLALADHQLPRHARYWDDFENALTATFGEPDPIASATNKLENLVMKDYHHLNKYNIDFNEYSTIAGFSDRDLYARYYKGLAPRIKDALVFSGRPTTLAALRERAQHRDHEGEFESFIAMAIYVNSRFTAERYLVGQPPLGGPPAEVRHQCLIAEVLAQIFCRSHISRMNSTTRNPKVHSSSFLNSTT
jgi:hypothetical protein